MDMQEQLIEAKKQVAVAIADEKKLQKQFEKEKELALKWEEKAMLAVKAGNDELAKKALERKSEHAQTAGSFETNWHQQKNQVEKLKEALTKLSHKINEAKRKKNLLIARAKRAEAQKTIAETMSGMSNTSAFDTIARMEEKVDTIEAEASATAELEMEMGEDNLEKEFANLGSVAADDELAALKASMGMAKEEEAPAQADLAEIEKEIEAEVAAKS
jgi:phage shock protein A